MKSINEVDFEREVLQAAETTLVDFWAEWCGPCRMLAPVLEDLSKEGFKIVKVDVTRNAELSAKYNVGAIPALLFFKAGELKKTLVGLQKKDTLKAIFEDLRDGQD